VLSEKEREGLSLPFAIGWGEGKDKKRQWREEKKEKKECKNLVFFLISFPLTSTTS